MPQCDLCPAEARVRDLRVEGGRVEEQRLCRRHAREVPELRSLRRAAAAAKRSLAHAAARVDPGARAVVEALNRVRFLRTTCSCDGMHEGARAAYVEFAPIGTAPATMGRFERFVEALAAAVRASPLRGAAAVDRRTALAEVRLAAPTSDAWGALAGLIRRIPVDRGNP
jgi:hypothetical protein